MVCGDFAMMEDGEVSGDEASRGEAFGGEAVKCIKLTKRKYRMPCVNSDQVNVDQRAAGCDQCATDLDQRAVGCGQRAADLDQRAAGCGQRAADLDQRAAGRGQCATDRLDESLRVQGEQDVGNPVRNVSEFQGYGTDPGNDARTAAIGLSVRQDPQNHYTHINTSEDTKWLQLLDGAKCDQSEGVDEAPRATPVMQIEGALIDSVESQCAGNPVCVSENSSEEFIRNL